MCAVGGFMKTMLFLTALCAFAEQPAKDPDVLRLLAGHNITSATQFAVAYQTFQTAVNAIPAATADAEKSIACVKQQPVTFACDDGVRTAAKHFQAARFDLRYSHYKANGALEAMLAEVVARSLMTGNDRLTLSVEEDAAVGRYLKQVTTDFERNFAAAEREWQKTWRRVEKVVDHRHQINNRRARQEGARLIYTIPIFSPRTARGLLSLFAPASQCPGRGR